MSVGVSKSRRLGDVIACALVTLWSAAGGYSQSVQSKFITFTGPDGSTVGMYYASTSLTSAGQYYDNTMTHGLVRSPMGAITSFDPDGSINTSVTGINGSAVVTGYYETPNSPSGEQIFHGFFRSPQGTITSFDPPGSTQTFPRAINNSGAIAGTYYALGYYGFVRSPEGSITSFGIAGQPLDAVMANSINELGTIAGSFQDNNSGAFHGFFRSPQGTITTFDPPGSTFTNATGINSVGQIAGYFMSSGQYHGFLRSPQGSITSFDPSGSLETIVTSINAEGAVAGFYNDASGAGHGFARSSQGVVTSFDVPGGYGYVIPYSITDFGVIAGRAQDLGFLRLP